MCIRDRRDIARLVALQNFDGGWPVWAKGDESLAYHSIFVTCLLYTSDAADERSSVDLGGRRIIKKKKTVSTRYEQISR